ncbi:MAG: ABC transporter ATP-binding protein [Candidatus Binatia bacterium]
MADIAIGIDHSEFFTLIGPSGCGKTTILDIVAGFVTPAIGDVLVEDKPVTGPGNDRVVVFQDLYSSLFPWMSVAENVEFGLKMAGVALAERKERAEHFLVLVGLGAHANKFPDELSGGMRQRVQLARALAIQPKVLLMDEPFGALDAYTRKALQVELLRVWSETKTTILFITHDILEAVFLSDRIGIMSPGPRARLIATVDVNIDRPRTLNDPAFASMVTRIENLQRDSQQAIVQ